jgi:pyruvate dehydrogenase E1 component alpha subunit
MLLRSFFRTQARLGSARFLSTVDIQFPDAFKTHLIQSPPTSTEVSKEDALKYLELMLMMRRMEITCDNEYKARAIRGFCHLYDGQEAVAVGIDAALDKADSIITSYRCHCYALTRGSTVEGVLSELFGFFEGSSHGKGGSMHFYNKAHNFYGGSGIVGAQVPCGVGLAFANKYVAKPGEKMNVALSIYGDGAANQGQVFEAANMAKLWDLPSIFVIENNQYGMGTAISRSSSNQQYYTMGNHIPGIKVDGMNVFAVREAMKYAKNFAGSGNGPIFIEMNTYRYHGHSMSDPGITYRSREEINKMRQTRDPIEFMKSMMVEKQLATADECKELERKVRNDVLEATNRAKAGKEPELDELFTNIYADENGKTQYPPVIRMPDRMNSRVFH